MFDQVCFVQVDEQTEENGMHVLNLQSHIDLSGDMLNCNFKFLKICIFLCSSKLKKVLFVC